MPIPLPYRVLRALDAANAAHPWDHNAHYHREILRRLPARFGRALDVGCGSGDMVRLLARRAEVEVVGVDADPDVVARARALTDASAPVRFVVAEVPAGVGEGVSDGAEGTAGPECGSADGSGGAARYEVITCLAALHHLPFAEALALFRRRLAPGGTLVVLGVHRTRGPVDGLLAVAAVPLNLAVGLLKNRGRRAVRPVSMTARTLPPTMAYREIVREARRLLPGVRVRRRLFWRHTLVWRAPNAPGPEPGHGGGFADGPGAGSGRGDA